MTLSDLISKIFNDTKRRTVSLRQLSFLLPSEEEDHVSDSESVVDKTAHDVGTDAFNSVQNDDDVSVETDSMFEYDTQFASNVKNKYVAEEYDSVVSFWVKELSRCQMLIIHRTYIRQKKQVLMSQKVKLCTWQKTSSLLEEGIKNFGAVHVLAFAAQ